MLEKVLERKIKALESRVRLLEGRPTSSTYGVRSTWMKIISRKPRMRDLEEERRAAILKRTAGSLKGKLPQDSVVWQRKLRAAWGS